MNKLRLLTLLLISAILIQSCKKDTITAIAYSTKPFQADIDGSTWTPDTANISINYDATLKTKTLTCIGTKDQKQIIMSIRLDNANSADGFTTGSYNVDSTKVAFQYNTQQKNSSGVYVFLPHGTVSPGAGNITITTVDTVNKQISGTFFFYSRAVTYDGSGNVLSISIDNILGGEFTKFPYTVTTN